MRARRSYDQNPWIRSSFSRNLNRDNVKSEAITACIPSCPEIPTPTSAIWIIDTSFAPSPIANVLKCNSSLTIFTRKAFCRGVERQQRTHAQYWVRVRNGFVRFDLEFEKKKIQLNFYSFLVPMERYILINLKHTVDQGWMLGFCRRQPTPESYWPLLMIYPSVCCRFHSNRNGSSSLPNHAIELLACERRMKYIFSKIILKYEVEKRRKISNVRFFGE